MTCLPSQEASFVVIENVSSGFKCLAAPITDGTTIVDIAVDNPLSQLIKYKAAHDKNCKKMIFQ